MDGVSSMPLQWPDWIPSWVQILGSQGLSLTLTPVLNRVVISIHCTNIAQKEKNWKKSLIYIISGWKTKTKSEDTVAIDLFIYSISKNSWQEYLDWCFVSLLSLHDGLVFCLLALSAHIFKWKLTQLMNCRNEDFFTGAWTSVKIYIYFLKSIVHCSHYPVQ